MAGDTMRFRNPAGHAGLLNNLLALLNSLVGFLESRIGLVARESKSALVHILVLAGALIAALLLLALGYLFLVASAVLGIAHGFHISPVWVALGAAVLHFILCGVCVVLAMSRLRKPIFEVSAAELKKDRQWLKNLDRQNLSTS
ncbi:MAG: phage holin family protein [Chthoniobacterales bacterium]|nr:phage holin family protein [Chthoniobacterales bacterium]